MSENWSDVSPNRPTDESSESAGWSTNGNGLIGTAGEANDGSPLDAEAPTVSETAESPAQETASSVETAVAEAPSADGEASEMVPEVTEIVAEQVDTTAPDSEPAADDSTSFLAELTRAMRATAGQERARINEEIERRRQSHLDQVREREAAEAGRMRELADEDMAAIEAWADAEVARINSERQAKADALRTDLETSLAEHRSLISGEVERIEAAIASHQADVASFFDRLEGETDPVAIAQLAMQRPAFPALDLAAAAATETTAAAPSPEAPEDTGDGDGAAGAAGEEAGPPLVGVMADESAAESMEQPWQAQAETVAVAGEAGTVAETATETPEASDDPESVKPAVQTPVTAVVSSPRPRSSVLHSVPALRPMGSWLGRHTNSDRSDLKS